MYTSEETAAYRILRRESELMLNNSNDCVDASIIDGFGLNHAFDNESKLIAITIDNTKTYKSALPLLEDT